MDFIGGIDGMNFTPISNYNNYIKNTKAFDIDTSNMDFEAILNKQTSAMQDSMKIQGGVQVNANLEDVAAQAAMQVAEDPSSSGNLIKSLSKSVNGGLSSVNDAIKAADKAQEAMAMGEDVSVHDVMIAAEKASLSMQMAMQLRNKLMTAYTELNNVKV